jgi:hypothetical protein
MMPTVFIQPKGSSIAIAASLAGFGAKFKQTVWKRRVIHDRQVLGNG